ncbi:YjbH domain-containing protein [Spirosoma jeollabukense]
MAQLYFSNYIRNLGRWLVIALLLAGISPLVQAQVNIAGKPGLIYIPSARVLDDGTFWAGCNYNPISYAFRFNKTNSESIYFVNLSLLPRLEINLSLLRPNGPVPFGARGIGDRQLDLKYVFLTERSRRPAVALIVSAPFGIDNSLETYALVATKSITLTTDLQVEVTGGMGSPYYIYRDEKNDQNSGIFSNFTWRDKREKPYYYLAGPFGGLVLRYKTKGGLLAEWDSQHLNVGAYTTLWKHWTIQGGLINGNQVTLGTSYSFSLH